MNKITPMQLLKTEISTLKELEGFSHFELNGRSGGYSFGGAKTYYKRPISFDYLLVLGSGETYRDEKSNMRHVNTISLAFDFKQGETVIRAGAGIRGAVDYSNGYSINEFRPKLKEFLKNPSIDFFVKLFGIKQSKHVTEQEVSKTVRKLIKRVVELKEKIKSLQDELYSMKMNVKHKPDLLTNRMRGLFTSKKEEVAKYQGELQLIYNEEIKNMPYIIRKTFLNSKT